MDIIVAADRNWGIGRNGDLLCHIPGDLKYFKEKTMGAAVVMGRKTLESLPGGKPLPGRRNIVLTRRADFQKEGCEVAHDAAELQALLEKAPGEGPESARAGEGGRQNVFVIGGAEVYAQLLDLCETVYVTRMENAFDADKFFPDLDRDPDFELVRESEPHEEGGVRYRFTVYKRHA